MARGQRRRPHALLRRVLALRLSRGRADRRRSASRRISGCRGDARGRRCTRARSAIGVSRPARTRSPIRCSWRCLDIDRMPEAMRVSRADRLQPLELGVVRRSGSFRRSGRAAASARRAPAPPPPASTLPDGPIYLLTHLRYAGYVFNPISLFYCYDSRRRAARRCSPRSTTPTAAGTLLAAGRRRPLPPHGDSRDGGQDRSTSRRSCRSTPATSSC